LLCGDSCLPETYQRLLDSEKADLVFTDPPYNVPIEGHVSGNGKTTHREFAMASGEMSQREFADFLEITLGAAVNASRDGALHYVCMDWRHLYEMISCGRAVYGSLINMCVWNKTNGGMGSFYRSQHELVFVFKVGTQAHTNTVELGRHGRNRTNVWDYAGANAFGPERQSSLAVHPTVKPVALIADAIKDATRRGELVLDPFCGSGSTIIAAEKTGRRGRGVEIDPQYVDVIIRRWQQCTGKEALLVGDAGSFEDVAEQRGVRNVG
ncbi:MAG: site-specific DNA-methyltransferase, partial [Methylobacteriaceae bacterium]|nr:site-specific DNA-methyltransferase [Methylobacteriaceae bacterium]